MTVQRGRGLAVVLLATALLAACDPAPPRVGSAAPDGTVGRPATVLGRDVGVSAPVAGKVTWLFGDTVFTPASCDGTNLRNSTAGLGTLASIHVVAEPTDACGAPYELFTPRVPNRPDGTRVAFWPDSIVAHPNGTDGVVFYQRVAVRGLTDMVTEGTLVDELPASDPTHIERSNEVELFGPADPSFVSSNLVANGYIYLYTANLTYQLARVPVTSYRDRSAYRFWTGSGWSPNITSATELRLGGVNGEEQGGLGGMTVSWNRYLGRYLMTHSDPFESDVMLRVASRPEGPWSPPTHVDVPDPDPSFVYGNYSAREHPHYSPDGGKTIFVTYSRPLGGMRQDLQVVRVVFR